MSFLIFLSGAWPVINFTQTVFTLISVAYDVQGIIKIINDLFVMFPGPGNNVAIRFALTTLNLI